MRRRPHSIDNLDVDVKILYWSAPRIWPDSVIFILGGGPSIKYLDLTKIQGKWPVIGCNMAFLDYPWVDVVYFGDCKVHMWVTEADKGRYAQQFDAYTGLKVSLCPDTRNDNRINALFRYRNGIVTDRRSLGWNMNTGGSAINLAYHFGAKKVVLLGFDMKQKDGKMNFHNYNFVSVKHPKNVLSKFKKNFEYIAKDAKRLGLEIINAVHPEIGSDLPYFKQINYEEVIKSLESNSGVSRKD